MIEVRIRKENEPTTHAVRLCELNAEDIDILVDSILEWGLFFDGNCSDLSVSCQYVYYNAEAYFEIAIAEKNEGKPDDD